MDVVLIGFTLAAWIVHSTVAGLYSKKFASTKKAPFRLVHATEIFITVLITMLLYTQFTDPSISVGAALITVLGTLAVLDGISIAAVQKLRDQFDIGHFIFAYSAVALAITVVMA